MIRLATFEDVPELQRLIALSVRGLSDEYYTTGQIESAIRYVFGIDSQLIVDGTYYIFKKQDIIVGCGGWSKRNTAAMALPDFNWGRHCRAYLYTYPWDIGPWKGSMKCCPMEKCWAS